MRWLRSAFLATIAVLPLSTGLLLADGPQDNQAENVRRIPKLGIEVPADVRTELEQGLSSLAEKLAVLKPRYAGTLETASVNGSSGRDLYADVAIFHRAVDQALRYQEFFDAKELPVAAKLLSLGHERADQLLKGQHPWTTQTGLVVRGYLSELDDTPQPYGLVIPDSYSFVKSLPTRLDFWFHGRGETLSELNFLNQRLSQVGSIQPAETIVLHPYGRYCNANKLAGEVDGFEGLSAVERGYNIDSERIAVRGFSMGGAAAWHFAVHYPDRWFAANPGAGFSETPDFLKVFQNEALTPPPFERTLWHLYDCTDYAVNLSFLPTVAYSGEIDKQKQAADIMAAAMQREGLELMHIIGPMTAHKIHPDSLKLIEERLAELATTGIDRAPSKIRFVTYTLKYNSAHWVKVLGLEEHWKEARIEVEHVDGNTFRGTTKNIMALALMLPKSLLKGGAAPVQLELDGSVLSLPSTEVLQLVKTDAGWQAGYLPERGLRKKSGLQGPIDDALMAPFIFVKPTKTGYHPEVDAWVNAELEHAVVQWRQQMRGDAIVKNDTDLTDDDIRSKNLILWGDPQSNAVIGKIAKSLPIGWAADKVTVGEKTYDAAKHGVIAVYPNPLNPNRYMVLNSSFTYREYDYLNNARQVPKLPDWAIIDITTPPNSRYPGKIVAADFFDESWRLK
ncbi:MAG: hypothetical protein KF777_09900 [Planctomycetaceae bacterium]|nr:hypothetical protein [Planctomycetaceae bacterium]